MARIDNGISYIREAMWDRSEQGHWRDPAEALAAFAVHEDYASATDLRGRKEWRRLLDDARNGRVRLIGFLRLDPCPLAKTTARSLGYDRFPSVPPGR